MSDRCVIEGSYADFRLVKTRSVAQLVIEIPIERAAAFIEAFGIPLPGQEIAVAIARLVEIGDDEQPVEPVEHVLSTNRANGGHARAEALSPERRKEIASEAAKARWKKASERGKAAFRAKSDMEKDVTRAAMLIKDERFQYWMVAEPDEIETDRCLKETLNITSKREIATDPVANARFRTMVTTFLAETGQLAEVR